MKDSKARMGDVAQLSGLSRSTVDRVLNGRPGVRAETVQRVEDAMRQLGYAPSSLSARQVMKIQTLAIVMPKGTNPFFAEMRAGFDAAASDEKYLGLTFRTFTFDAYDPDTLCDVLSDIPDDIQSVITLGVDNPEATRAISALSDAGKRVVTVVSDAPLSRRFAFVGQDNFAAGRTAARLMAAMVPPGPGEVALLLGHLQFRHLLDRMSGFRQVLGLARPDLTLIQPPAYGADPTVAKAIVEDLGNKATLLQGVYLAGGGQPELIDAIAACTNHPIRAIGHETTPAMRRALFEGRFQAVLAHDMGEVSHKAIDIVIGLGNPQDGACHVNIHVPDNLPG